MRRKQSSAIDLSVTYGNRQIEVMASECHKFYTCYKWKYKHNKRLRLALGMTAVGLGVVGGIVTAVTLNPLPVTCISGAGLLIGGFTAKSGVNKKVETCRFAYTAYLKHLRKLKAILNGLDVDYDMTVLSTEWAYINDTVIDMCPTINGMEKRYAKLYTKRSGVMDMNV